MLIVGVVGGMLELCCVFFFFFKQKTAYEMRISDWSSDVCSSDLGQPFGKRIRPPQLQKGRKAVVNGSARGIDGGEIGFRRFGHLDQTPGEQPQPPDHEAEVITAEETDRFGRRARGTAEPRGGKE